MQVPVGNGTLGRIINVIGEPVDEQGPIRECWLHEHTAPCLMPCLELCTSACMHIVPCAHKL